MTTNGTSDLTGLMETQAFQIEELTERLAELELALDDAGWDRLGDEGREFGHTARRRIVELCRTLALKNPLVKRGVAVQVFYVWGQGCAIRAAHPTVNAVVQAFLDDEKNQSELTSQQARESKEKELQTDGNIFFVLFPNAITGAVRVRTIPVGEIQDILTDPEDAKSPRYYQRVWTTTTLNARTGQQEARLRTEYYPDWRYTPRTKPKVIGNAPIHWESPIYHVKVGAYSDWKFGCSEIYAAIDWARAYKEFLEDWATLTRALSRYAWKVAVKGGARGVAAAKAKLGTTLGQGGSLLPETNPSATVGATWIGAEGNDMQPVKTAGAQVSMEDGRRMLLMVAAAQNLPESFYGDVSVGTLATATSLDRPTELAMRSRQTLWADIHKDLFAYISLWAVKAAQGKLRGLATVVKEADGDEVSETLRWATETVTDDDGATAEREISGRVDMDFPPIVAPDRKADVEAIIAAATLGGKSPQTLDRKTLLKFLLSALGISDIDEVIDEVLSELAAEQEQMRADAAQAQQDALALAQARQQQVSSIDQQVTQDGRPPTG